MPTGVYLAALRDAWSRTCVGWRPSRTLDTSRALAVVARAAARRDLSPGRIQHSDQRVPDAHDTAVDRLDAGAARVSMAAVGHPSANATAARFFRARNGLEVALRPSDSFTAAAATIDHGIADVYHAKRLRSSLGYRPPSEFETLSAAAR